MRRVTLRTGKEGNRPHGLPSAWLNPKTGLMVYPAIGIEMSPVERRARKILGIADDMSEAFHYYNKLLAANSIGERFPEVIDWASSRRFKYRIDMKKLRLKVPFPRTRAGMILLVRAIHMMSIVLIQNKNSRTSRSGKEGTRSPRAEMPAIFCCSSYSSGLRSGALYFDLKFSVAPGGVCSLAEPISFHRLNGLDFQKCIAAYKAETNLVWGTAFTSRKMSVSGPLLKRLFHQDLLCFMDFIHSDIGWPKRSELVRNLKSYRWGYDKHSKLIEPSLAESVASFIAVRMCLRDYIRANINPNYRMPAAPKALPLLISKMPNRHGPFLPVAA